MRLCRVLIIFLSVLAFILPIQAFSQNSEMLKTVDAVINNAQLHALNSSLVNWDSLRQVVHESSKTAQSIEDLKPALQIVVDALQDKQAVFYNPTTMLTLAGNQESVTVNSPGFAFTILENNIRYIRLEHIPYGKDLQVYAQQIRAAVDSLMKGDALPWIVDLRYASGGDLKPLLSGIAPVMDEGLVASTMDNKRKVKDLYTVHNGNFYLNQVAVGKFAPHATDHPNARVAVLISEHTRGAAEVIAIGLRGRKNTRFFGEATAGQSFGMANIEISKNLAMRFSEMMYVDKKGNEYKGPIRPETKVKFSEASQTSSDTAIAQASLWLTAVDQEKKIAMLTPAPR